MNKKLIRLTESDLHRIVKESVNRILRESDELPYLSDDDIHKQYEGFEISEFTIKPRKVAYGEGYTWDISFEISFPNVDHPDFDDSKWENVFVYDEKGERMAFEGWYPDDIAQQLVEMVRAEIRKHWPEMEAFKKKTRQEEDERMRQQELMFQQYALKKGKRI